MTSIAKNICLCLLFEVIRQDLSNISNGGAPQRSSALFELSYCLLSVTEQWNRPQVKRILTYEG